VPVKGKRPCADCGTPIGLAGKTGRCRHCAQSGPRNHRYIGGRALTRDGYVVLTGYHSHPNCRKDGTILEHVLVMSQVLERPLTPEETVHHRNGDRQDNRPENLELWTGTQPPGQRVTDKVEWAVQVLILYKDQPEVLPYLEQLREALRQR
jgi:hypothetical protein